MTQSARSEFGSLWREAMEQARQEKANWLEDVVSGLLVNGVQQKEIEIQEHPEMVTVVLVRGLPKYEYKIRTLTT